MDYCDECTDWVPPHRRAYHDFVRSGNMSYWNAVTGRTPWWYRAKRKMSDWNDPDFINLNPVGAF